jgi:hypothetical protein
MLQAKRESVDSLCMGSAFDKNIDCKKKADGRQETAGGNRVELRQGAPVLGIGSVLRRG